MVNSLMVLMIVGCMLIAGVVAYTPSASITIDRDTSGTVHVNAANELDLFYGQGRAMAEDRLWQIDFNTRAAKGTLAEILGSAGLSNDVLMRTLGLWNSSQEAVKVLDADVLAELDAFTSGMNDYISENHPLPFEFGVLGYAPTRFTPADVIIISKFMAAQLASNFNAELDRFQWEHGLGLTRTQIDSLFPKYEPWFPTTLSYEDVARMRFTGKLEPLPAPRFAKRTTRSAYGKRTETEEPEEFPVPKMSIDEFNSADGPQKWLKNGARHIASASNIWVIGGSRTASRAPLLMNDPHLTLSMPAIWTLMSLKCPTINVTGATIVGAPGITSGRNEKITWGVTNVGADVQDLYVLTLGSEGKTYIHRGTEYDFVLRYETIVVKGGQTIVLPVRETLYGPVISDSINMYGNTVALQWTSLLSVNDTTHKALLAVNKAKNFQEFRAAFKKYYIGASQNFFYADTDGNIGYQVPGKIPVRRGSADGQYAVAGTGANDWMGYIPFEELPSVINPSRGYLVNANNKVAPDNYPYTILNNRDWEIHYRASRIEELVKARRDHTVATQIAIQTDQTTYSWNDMQTILLLIPTSRLDTTGKQWRNTLLTWDGNCAANDTKPTVYEFWIYELGRLGNFSGYAHVYGTYYVYSTILKSLGRLLPFAADAFQTTVNTLLKNYNGTIPRWGDVNLCTLLHPVLGSTPYAPLVNRKVIRGGDYTTINVAGPNSGDLGLKQYSKEVANPFFNVQHGPSYRHIVDLSGKNMETKSVYSLPGGQSGSPSSPHYADLLPGWAVGQYIPMKMYNYTLESREVYP